MGASKVKYEDTKDLQMNQVLGKLNLKSQKDLTPVAFNKFKLEEARFFFLDGRVQNDGKVHIFGKLFA